MKNSKIKDSWSRIEPDGSADSRILSSVLAENRRVREEREDKMTINQKKAGKRALTFALAAALIFTLTIGVGAAGGLGRLFSLITQNDGSDAYNGDNLELIAERMEPVTGEITSTQKGNLKFSVKEAYYDGMTLYCASEIETDIDPNAEETDWNFDIYINGVKLDFDYTLNARRWVKSEDGKYISDSMSTKIPDEFRPKGTGDIRVKYVATHYSYGGENGNGDLEAASSEFTVACRDDAVNIAETVMQNDVKFRYLRSSTATTEVCMDVPVELSENNPDISCGISLSTEDGKYISLNTGIEDYSDEEPEKYSQLIYSGEAVPEGVTTLIAQLNAYDTSDNSNTVAAKFRIDLVEKSVVPID